MEIFSSPSSRARERRTERRCPHGARAQRARLQEKPRPLSWGRGYLPRPGPEEASRSSAATHRVRRWPCVLPEGCAAGGGARAGMAAVGKRRGDAAGYLRPPAAAAIEGEPMSRRQEQRRGGPARPGPLPAATSSCPAATAHLAPLFPSAPALPPPLEPASLPATAARTRRNKKARYATMGMAPPLQEAAGPLCGAILVAGKLPHSL